MDAVAGRCSQAWSSYGLCHCEPQNIWGDDGPHKGCPAMGPSGSCDPGRVDGEDELLHWPSTFHQPLVLLQLMMLCKLQEVPILGMVGRKSPGGSMPWGNWGQTRKSPGKLALRGKGRNWSLQTPKDIPGDFILRGHHSRMNPVTQEEMLGDLCQREHPCQRRAQNAMLRQILPTSCHHKSGRWRRHHTKSPTGWGGAVPGRHWVGVALPSLLTSTSPPPLSPHEGIGSPTKIFQHPCDIYTGITRKNTVEMVFMLGHFLHVQQCCHLTCNGRTSIENVWWNITVIVLCQSYNFTHVICRLWQYGLHCHCLQASWGSTRGNVTQYQLVYMKVTSHFLFTLLKFNILHVSHFIQSALYILIQGSLHDSKGVLGRMKVV